MKRPRTTRRLPPTADERAASECRAAGMRPEVWPRTFISAELAHSTVEVIISPLLNGLGADEHVFERDGARMDDSWLSEWDDEEPP